MLWLVSRSRSFLRLFAQLTMASSAVVACSADDPAGPASPVGVDRTGFDIDVCSGGTAWRDFSKFTPSSRVDFITYLTRDFNTPPYSWGTPCIGATDDTCLAIAKPTDTDRVNFPGDWWKVPAEYPYSGLRRLVYTRGPDVGYVGTIPQLIEFMSGVDTPFEATFLASEAMQRYVSCDGKPNARFVTGGIELITHYSTCGAVVGANPPRTIISTYEVRLFVGTDGTMKVLQTAFLHSSAGGYYCGPAPGRRPEGLEPSACSEADDLGAYFAESARLEAASVHAFERLAEELTLHGAPKRLVRAARRARADEVRHARTTRALAKRFGARPRAAKVRRVAPRDLMSILRENAIEGCVRETYAALLATHQARNATDPSIARAMRTIARDETRHAALAWDVAEWAERDLDATQRAELAQLRAQTVAELEASTTRGREVPEAGLPDRSTALRLVRSLFARLSS